MTIPTLDFTGNATTFIGFTGVASSLVIIVVAFRRYWSSPLKR
jgi:hypothetical protein